MSEQPPIDPGRRRTRKEIQEERRATRAAERAAEKAVTKSPTQSLQRRLLMGVGGTAILIATTLGLYKALNQEPVTLNDQLTDLGDKMRRDPAHMDQYAREIGGLAAKIFCEERACDPNQMASRFIFQNRPEFISTIQNNNPCTIPENVTGRRAYVPSIGNQIYVDLDVLRELSNPNLRSAVPRPADVALEEDIHELHHSNAENKKPETDDRIYDAQIRRTFPVAFHRGFTAKVKSPERSQPGRICLITYDNGFDEAAVQDNTLRTLQKQGIRSTTGVYSVIVDTLRSRIINPYFNGNNKQLVDFQQQSNFTEFLEVLGIKLGAPRGQETQVAYQYILDLFPAQP